jgi:cyclopropane fatty-acyl-phospholipid synthase-like methyltransferase
MHDRLDPTETFDPCSQAALPLLLRYVDRFPAGGRVLEIGIDHGRHILPLARRGMRVTGVTTDEAALADVRECAKRENLPVELWRGEFTNFAPAKPFQVVMVFDLLQTLTRSDGAGLIYRVTNWLETGGLLLLTALHVDDPCYDRCRDGWDKIGLHSFRRADGMVRTFLARREILDLLLGWEIVHHNEGQGPPHTHGEAAPQRHGVVEIVVRKRI